MLKPKPKKLNLREMWKVYNLLKPALSEETTIETTIETIIEEIEAYALVECFTILYDNFNSDKLDVVGLLEMFANGLRQNNFMLFVEEIEKWQQKKNK